MGLKWGDSMVKKNQSVVRSRRLKDLKEAEGLLKMVAHMQPWLSMPMQGDPTLEEIEDYNLCRFCDNAWEHADDCLWMAVRAHFSLPTD